MRHHHSFLSVSLLGAFVAAAAAGCSGDDGAAPSTGTEAEALFAAKKLLWANGSVDVCFEASTDPNASHWRDIVKTWATGSWEQNSQIVFHGWGTCDAESPGDGIRISFQDTQPHTSQFGTQNAGVASGMVLNNVFANFQGVPGVPVDTMVGWVTVHEFGHALGFMHEQDRPDAPSSASPTGWVAGYGMSEAACIQAYATNKGSPYGWYDEAQPTGALSPIGFYDHVSVMNYCCTGGYVTNAGVLSVGDVAAVQKLYGAPLGTAAVNDTANPVSSAFPLSTVNLMTPGLLRPSCTGLILTTSPTSTKILTAAHCKVNSATTVQFYPTTAGAGAAQTATVLKASSSTPVAIQAGVVCDPDVPGSFPSTCYAGGGSPYYADLAVLTIDAPAPAGYVPIALGTRASLSAAPADTSAWEVGTGWGGSMQWAPVELNTPGDVGGFVALVAPFGQAGDSGGPVFQYVDPSLTSPNGLVALGMASNLGPCMGDSTCDSHANVYTSLVYPQNYDWLVAQGGAPAQTTTSSQTISSFGAAR